MKRHGIWAAIRARRHHESYRLSDLVGACSYRYLRMLNKGNPITVAQWNRTIAIVAHRCCISPWPVLRTLELGGRLNRANAWTVVPRPYGSRPTQAVHRYWWRNTTLSVQRLAQIRTERAERESRTCQGCGMVAESLSVTSVWHRHQATTGLTYSQKETAPTRYCVACWNRLRPVFRIRAEASELKRLTNQLKKVIHEEAA